MPFYWDFDAIHRIVRFRFEGRVTDAEMEKYYREATEIVEAVNPRAGVTDFTQVTSMEVSRQTIANLAKQAPILPDPDRPRVVIAPSPLVFGIMRMFEMEGGRTRPNLYVVQTAEAAWAILGVKEPGFAPYNN